MTDSTAAHIIEPRLKEWATERQCEYIDAVNEHGSYKAAARALGVSHDVVRKSIRGLESRAAVSGYAPDHDMEQTVPEPFSVKRISSNYVWDKDTGERRLSQQWVIANPTQDAWANAVRLEIAAALKDQEARLAPLPAPPHTLKSLLNFYVFTDYHLGMRAWSEEGGAEWNLQIAEDLIIRIFEHMVSSAPAAKVGFIANLGDFMHFDGLLPVTPTHGHVLDADGQYQQIVRACIRIFRKLIDYALFKHERVVVLAAEGNHDISSSVWMRELLKVLYEGEDRVEILDNPSPYYAYQWGMTMLGVQHGHLKKKEALPLVFAAAYPEMWGRTKKRYAHCGHNHHEVVVKEESGMRVIQHPTLAPRDSHSSRHAYFSERQTSVVTYHDVFGKVGVVVATPEMLGPPKPVSAEPTNRLGLRAA